MEMEYKRKISPCVLGCIQGVILLVGGISLSGYLAAMVLGDWGSEAFWGNLWIVFLPLGCFTLVAVPTLICAVCSKKSRGAAKGLLALGCLIPLGFAMAGGIIGVRDISPENKVKWKNRFIVDYQNKPFVSRILDESNTENLIFSDEKGGKTEYRQLYLGTYREKPYLLAETVGLSAELSGGILFELDYTNDRIKAVYNDKIYRAVCADYVKSQNKQESFPVIDCPTEGSLGTETKSKKSAGKLIVQFIFLLIRAVVEFVKAVAKMFILIMRDTDFGKAVNEKITGKIDPDYKEYEMTNSMGCSVKVYSADGRTFYSADGSYAGKSDDGGKTIHP